MKLIFLAILAFAVSLNAAQPVTPKHHYRLGYLHDKAGIKDPNWKGRKRATPINPHNDLITQMHAILDQGQEGSCVGHSCSETFDAAFFRATGTMPDTSRAYPYWNARAIEGTTSSDDGCEIRDAVTAMLTLGNCAEATWPYVVGDYAHQPSPAAFTEGKQRLVLKAYKVDASDGVSVRAALSAGLPVIIGVTLYQDFEDLDSSNYLVPMPRGPPIGGHAMTLYGSDDATQRYKVQNHWGTNWGNAGRCEFPYAYIHGPDCDDCWVIEAIVTAVPTPAPPTPDSHGWLWHIFHR